MVVPWATGLVFVGLTGMPHPHHLQNWAISLMSSFQINLDAFDDQMQQMQNQQNDQMQQMQNQQNDQNQEVANAAAAALTMVLVTVALIVGLVLFSFVGMCMYKSNVHDQKPAISGTPMVTGTFHYGICDCFSNINECMCSFCCPSIRFADTFSAINPSTGFWGAFFLFIFINMVPQILGNFLPQPADPLAAATQNAQIIEGAGCVVRGLVFGMWARKNLRTKLGDPNPGGAAAVDAIHWAIFPCLSLIQESVEADIGADVTISCPWTLSKGRTAVRGREVAPNDYESLLGDAVLCDR